MSATRDKTQKVTFIYSNLYEVYRKGKEAALSSPEAAASVSPEPFGFHSSGNVLKAQDLRSGSAAKVEAYAPAELIGKRVAKPEYLPSRDNAAIESLKKNLEQLNNLHARLRFMLQELEELVKE